MLMSRCATLAPLPPFCASSFGICVRVNDFFLATIVITDTATEFEFFSSSLKWERENNEKRKRARDGNFWSKFPLECLWDYQKMCSPCLTSSINFTNCHRCCDIFHLSSASRWKILVYLFISRDGVPCCHHLTNAK